MSWSRLSQTRVRRCAAWPSHLFGSWGSRCRRARAHCRVAEGSGGGGAHDGSRVAASMVRKPRQQCRRCWPRAKCRTSMSTCNAAWRTHLVQLARIRVQRCLRCVDFRRFRAFSGTLMRRSRESKPNAERSSTCGPPPYRYRTATTDMRIPGRALLCRRGLYRRARRRRGREVSRVGRIHGLESVEVIHPDVGCGDAPQMEAVGLDSRLDALKHFPRLLGDRARCEEARTSQYSVSPSSRQPSVDGLPGSFDAMANSATAASPGRARMGTSFPDALPVV